MYEKLHVHFSLPVQEIKIWWISEEMLYLNAV
jgi:hypothetical protein